MNKWIVLFCALILAFLLPLAFAAEKVIVLHIDGPIGPATQDYIERGISYANQSKVNAVIIQMNTPGGLETAMRGINEAIITASVPVIGYVFPAGARAASAGTFILYASNFAVMAPGTNLGAASPIGIGGQGEDTKKPSTSDRKAMNDAAAYIRSLAQLRDRNITWAESAVRTAESLSATEAKKLNVINEIAADYPDLQQKLNGKTTLVQGKKTTIHLNNATLEHMPTDWRHDFLSFLTNPNVAYILLLIAMYGLFFEFSNPGAILPGVAGIIALLLVLYAFQIMPINYTGLLLIAIGISFLISELYISSFGVLGIGGAIAFIIGSIMLFDMNNPYYHLTWTIIGGMSIITIAFFLLVATMAIRSHRKTVITGKEGLIGSEGMVLSVMNDQVIVTVSGEIWEARSPAMLTEKQHIRVTAVNGLILTVEPIPHQTVRSEGA